MRFSRYQNRKTSVHWLKSVKKEVPNNRILHYFVIVVIIKVCSLETIGRTIMNNTVFES